jgi:hypothetical protein
MINGEVDEFGIYVGMFELLAPISDSESNVVPSSLLCTQYAFSRTSFFFPSMMSQN